MADFLLELYSEEIPARMQAPASAAFCKALTAALAEHGLKSKTQEVYYSPQRLAVLLRGLPMRLPARNEEIKGPRVGAPDAALEGFLRKHKIQRKALTEKNGSYFLIRRVRAQSPARVLQATVPQVIERFAWPKSMRWGSGSLRWVRPLRNILCLLGTQEIRCKVGELSSNRHFFGHRFLSPGPRRLARAGQYTAALARRHVLVDAAERERSLRRQIAARLPKSTRLADSPALMAEVVGLVEEPHALLGTIDKAFLDLPEAVLRAVLEKQQRYFCVETARGKLAPYFIVAANHLGSDRGRTILAGCERVLRARLADAQFFWQQDKKLSLDKMAQGLSGLTFHERLGSMQERSERIGALANHLADALGGDKDLLARAARLCKADLLSDMVQEFPNLQGEMAAHYAEDTDVGATIREHYHPRHADDRLPRTQAGALLALADRLDLLAGFFAIDEAPSGSGDPYALRRAALGIVRIILEQGDNKDGAAFRSLSLDEYITLAAAPHDKTKIPALVNFLRERLAHHLYSKDKMRPDVYAALSAHEQQKAAQALNLHRTATRARALNTFLHSDAGKDLFVAFHRAAGILQRGKSAAAEAFQKHGVLENSAIATPNNLAPAQAKLQQSLQALRAQNGDDYQTNLEHLAALRAPIDTFFDDVLIEDKDDAVRAANHALLLDVVHRIAQRAGDLSLIDKSAFGAKS